MRAGLRVVGLLAVLGLCALAARADEEDIPLAKLPKKVVAAIKKQYGDAKMVSATKGKEDGETYYSVILEQKDDTLEVTLTPAGEIIEVAREIDEEDLPEAVAAAVKKKYPKATIREAAEVTEVTEKDRKVYHVELETADSKAVELTVSPKGKIEKEVVKEKKAKDK
jgi:hypothetical protein